MKPRSLALICIGWLCCEAGPAWAQAKPLSHPPLRTPPATAQRPLDKGTGYFVDARRGDDRNAGNQAAPWKTIRHALEKIHGGDTLYLRGTYYEEVTIRLAGRPDAPITIRSYPGEQATLDGGFREFFESPAEAWELWPKGRADEYRSKRSYPNLRQVLGAFGDSMIGLHTYYHAQDLRADNELWDLEDPANPKGSDVKPVWCGPGLWYDADSGHIHIRLAPTHLPEVANYRGVSDPRQLPLVIAPFRSVPLNLDGARHIRFQDLVIRGGGYDTVVLQQCRGIEFDNATVWCGTYGMRLIGVQGLTMQHSALHGSLPPWCYRTDTSLRAYPGRPGRNITRLGTHALLVQDAGREFSVYFYPINDDWEIAHCDFTDAHDGIYLGGVNVHFHDNQLLNTQDDGIYLSPMYERPGGVGATLRIERNFFRGMLTALAFGGSEDTHDKVFLCRNVFDLRPNVATGRPSVKSPKGTQSSGKIMGDHGSPPWSSMFIYHNTVVAAERCRTADMSLLGGSTIQRPRRLFNNILVHLDGLPAYLGPDPESGQEDGNLYWSPGGEIKKSIGFFDKFRKSPAFEASKKVYPAGFSSHSQLADPRFRKLETDAATLNDYRLQDGSPAIDAGVDLPAEWPDPLRKLDASKPDIGALPAGAAPLQVGRGAIRSKP